MNNFGNFGSQQPGGRQLGSKIPTGQKVVQQLGGQFSAEFAQDSDVPLVAKRVQQSAQNKIQDNYKTPNEQFTSEFAAETQGTLRQKVQNSEQNKIQDNYRTPNEQFTSEFAAETQGTLRQKVQNSERSKIQDNYKTPNEKFDERFDSK